MTTEDSQGERPAGIDGSSLAGPFPVGQYAARLRERLREFERVQLFGEIWNLREARTKIFFELRDGFGAIPCSIWRNEWERLVTESGALADGTTVVVAGGCDYYPGSATSSPSFSFEVKELRSAGEGDLLAQLDRLRKQLDSEGLLDPQKQLPISALPKTIGVITGESGKARDDLVAALERRGWNGTIAWAFAPVQDRHAAGRITDALQSLAAIESVETVVITRGGGSLADLFAFCDETLCRTVALLRVPVIASIGHHTDRTLLDDVAAVSCSTPTHAAEAAVRIDCVKARSDLRSSTSRLERNAGRAIAHRARTLASMARAPKTHIDRHRSLLHQKIREIRASSLRRLLAERLLVVRELTVIGRKRGATLLAARDEIKSLGLRLETLDRAAGNSIGRASERIERARLTLAAADPQSTVEKGFAVVTDRDENLINSAAQARRVGQVKLRFRDGTTDATIEDQ